MEKNRDLARGHKRGGAEVRVECRGPRNQPIRNVAFGTARHAFTTFVEYKLVLAVATPVDVEHIPV